MKSKCAFPEGRGEMTYSVRPNPVFIFYYMVYTNSLCRCNSDLNYS